MSRLVDDKRRHDSDLMAEEHRQHWLDARAEISHLKAILEVLNTNNEIASLHDRELWSIHGELQKIINEAIA